MIDIDHFKQLNDNFGHRFADLCLIDAGRLIRNVVAGQEVSVPATAEKSLL